MDLMLFQAACSWQYRLNRLYLEKGETKLFSENLDFAATLSCFSLCPPSGLMSCSDLCAQDMVRKKVQHLEFSRRPQVIGCLQDKNMKNIKVCLHFPLAFASKLKFALNFNILTQTQTQWTAILYICFASP